MMHKKIILFDIDYTLFNAKQYKDNFVKDLQKSIGYKNSEIFLEIEEKAYNLAKEESGYFDPELFLEILSKNIGIAINKNVLEEIMLNENKMVTALYSDTLEVLKKIAIKNIEIGIFSAGEIRMQELKIASMKQFINREHVHIFEFKKTRALENLLQKYKNDKLYIIDDVKEILAAAKHYKNDVITIWIRRDGRLDLNNNEFKPDYAIYSLDKVLDIIN